MSFWRRHILATLEPGESRLLRLVVAWIGGMLGLLVALPILLLMMPLLLVSKAVAGTARLLVKRQPAVTSWGKVFVDDSEVGWVLARDLDCHVYDMGGNAFHFTTDADGWRIGGSGIERSDIVVFGDSFAFGHGVDDRSFFGWPSSECSVKSVGVPGFNMVQALLLMRRLQAILRGKLVIWMVYPGNDLDDNLGPAIQSRAAPFVFRDDQKGWVVVNDHIRLGRVWWWDKGGRSYERFVKLCSNSHLADRAFSAFRFLVEQAKERTEQAAARLVVVCVPDLSRYVDRRLERTLEDTGVPPSFDRELPDRRMARICAETGVTYVSLSGVLKKRHYQWDDIHWNAEGHRVVRSVMAALSAEDGNLDRRIEVLGKRFKDKGWVHRSVLGI